MKSKIVLLLTLLAGWIGPEAWAEVPQLNLLSVSLDGAHAGEDSSQRPRMSADGRFIVFDSGANDLTDDAPSLPGIVLHDRDEGSNRFISRLPDGGWPNFPAILPKISTDGNFVLFLSRASSLTPDPVDSLNLQLFLIDRRTESITLVTKTSDGTPPDGSVGAYSISHDGRFVAFSSRSTNLTRSQEPEVPSFEGSNVFLYDRIADSVTLVSRSIHGGSGNAPSTSTRISADGQYLIFVSRASDLTADQNNNGTASDIYLYAVGSRELRLISRAIHGGTGNGTSTFAVISADGSRVYFSSDSSNLTPAVDTNGRSDIFLFDRLQGTVDLVSRGLSGTAGNGISTFPQISYDGASMVFLSTASDLVSDEDNNQLTDVFAYNLYRDEIKLVSKGIAGGAGNDRSRAVEISGNGKYMAFISSASNLTTDIDNNLVNDLFLYEVATESLTLVSKSIEGGSGSGQVWSQARFGLSTHGRYLVFASEATDHTSHIDLNSRADVFLYDQGPTTSAVDVPNLGSLALVAFALTLVAAAFRRL